MWGLGLRTCLRVLLAAGCAAIAGGAPIEKGTGYWTVLSLGLAATVIVTTLVTRTAGRALREGTGQ